MNAEKQQETIAIKLGLTCELCRKDPGSDLWSCGCKRSWPDFLNDRNALIPVIESLPYQDQPKFMKHVYDLASGVRALDMLGFVLVTMPNQQLAEALLKTWNLWEEEK